MKTGLHQSLTFVRWRYCQCFAIFCNCSSRNINSLFSNNISNFTITERFSSIGSVPVLTDENIIEVVERVVEYLRSRISSKVTIDVSGLQEVIIAQINAPLFEWVIENVIKNAVDAMVGVGHIKIHIMEGSDWKVFVDISDNGKGISPSKMKSVFNPGFTTKKRGWGLGLALAERIIENYHKGKIFVKSSEVDKGSTFRVVLNRTH